MLVDLAAAHEQMVSETRTILHDQVGRLRAAIAHMSQGLCMYDAITG